MIFITVSFDYNNRKGMYDTLHDVLLKSIEVNAPDEKVIAVKTRPPQIKGKACFSSNNLKLKIWLDELNKLPDGENVLFLDADMLCLKNPVELFDRDFDIAYTVRPRKKPPINGGCVYIKNNERSRAFIKRWQEIDEKMYNSPGFHKPWRVKYAGMNQAAFGYLFEHKDEWAGAKLVPVPCEQWNCCNETWRLINEHTRLVHIKGPLRRACLSGKVTLAGTEKAVKLWKEYYEMIGGRMNISVNLTPQMRPKPRKVARKTAQLPTSHLSTRKSISDLRGKK